MEELNFINEETLKKLMDDAAIQALSKKTKRHGDSISLRPILYNCIRATFYEIMGYDTTPVDPENITVTSGFCLLGPIGDAIHGKLQSLLGLDKFQYTEKYMSFKDEQVSPLITVRTKSDGLDEVNHIFWEIKTKDRLPDEPYKEELAQNICGAWLFSRNLKIPIYGATMLYFNRNLTEYKFFHYNFINPNSPYYFCTDPIILEFIDRLKILNESVKINKVPSMDGPYIKKIAYGKSNCDSCVYRIHCQREQEGVIL